MRHLYRYLCFCLLYTFAITSCLDKNSNLDTPTSDQGLPTIGSTAPTESARKTIITLAVDDGSVHAYQQLVTIFEADRSDIQVRVIGSSDLPASINGDIYESAARGADVFPVSSNFNLNPNYVLNLKPLLDVVQPLACKIFMRGYLTPQPFGTYPWQ